MEKDISCQRRSKESRSILISDKIYFEMKTVIRDREGHKIMIKGSTQEEDIAIINTYAPNIGARQYIRQMNKYERGN